MIKRIFPIFLACTMMFFLTACSNSSGNLNEGASPSATQTPAAQQPSQSGETTPEPGLSESEGNESKALVVYFSATGNTKSVAEKISELQGTDLYEIVPEQLYTAEDLNYNDRSTRATVEQNDENARPAIDGSIDHIENYDVIYVGYPIWWGDMPRILYTFFDTYDLSGKTIVPFCTSGGSGLSGTAGTIEFLEPNASVLQGLHINDSAVSSAEGDITEWISSIGLSGQEE